MPIINTIKQSIHSGLRMFGLDIVKPSNLDAVIEARESERLRRKLKAIRTVRSESSILALPQKGLPAGAALAWVPAAELWEAGLALINDVNSVIDIGCAFRPQQFVDAQIHICCEPCEEYMDRLIAETSGSGKFVYLNSNLIQASQNFPACSVDSVFLIDVIEHVERESVLVSLERLKRIARRQIAVFTPLGFMPQDPNNDGMDQWGMNGVEWQRHQSGWTPDDFPAAEGWNVIACKDFHKNDGYNRPLEKPFGALWAIWTRG